MKGYRMKRQKKETEGNSSLPFGTPSHGRGRYFQPSIAHHGRIKGLADNANPFLISVERIIRDCD
jgi:hypothetical protein